jgi:hypothetical protein
MATGGINLAKKYSKKVDERFSKESFLVNALHNDYDFTGAKTVEIYSIPTAPMNDYARTGTSRYGTPRDAARNIQELTITRDRSFTTIIDKGDKLQSEGVTDAGRFLSRQIREACVPEYDAYGFQKLAAAAVAAGASSAEELGEDSAYEALLAANERFGDLNVPDTGRIAFCSYRYANLLMRDPAFSKDCDLAQKMLIKGTVGEVDGCRIVRVPANRLPAGAAFLLLHPMAACGPKQLEEFKIHENPPGISGWLCEGRFIYDFFILNSKADALWYHGSQPVLKLLSVITAASDAGKSTVLINPAVKDSAANTWYYCTAAALSGLEEAEYGTEIVLEDWTELELSGTEFTPTTGHKYIRVVEVDAEGKVIAKGDTVINIG